MPQWKFQLCPNMKHAVAFGYRLDEVGEAVEREVNDAIKYPLKFHGVKKIVVRLGPSSVKTPDYIELLGVGKKQYPNFNAEAYLAMSELQRRSQLLDISKSVFKWLVTNFEDADFALKAGERMGWDLS